MTLENIKKLVGWCPFCKKMAPQTKQSSDFAIMAPISGKTGQIPEFRTSNVVFRANTTLFFFLFLAGFNLLLRYPMDISLFLVGLLLFNIFCYLIVLKTYEAAVLVDKFGVHLQAFIFKKFEISYKEIESVTSNRLKKRSKELSLLLAIGGLAICGFVVYMAVVNGEWNILLLLISLLPLMLFMERKQKTRFGDLNTQLYIRTKHRKWYNWASYYSLITDEASAAEIKLSIEKNCEGI